MSETLDTMEELFGPGYISVYTRAQAHEDGVLVSVEDKSDTPYKYPVSFTSALWADVTVGQGSDPATLKARLWDVCYMSTLGRTEGSDSYFVVKVGRKLLHLRANCGPGDDAEPVMTIGYPLDF